MAKRKGRRKQPFKLKLKREILYSTVSVIFGLFALIVLLSFTRQGPFLTNAFVVLTGAFGWTAAFLPFLFVIIALVMTGLKWSLAEPTLLLGGLLTSLGLMGLTQAGSIGLAAYESLSLMLTTIGASLTYLAVTAVGYMLLTNTPLDEFLLFAARVLARLKPSRVSTSSPPKDNAKLAPVIAKINIPDSKEHKAEDTPSKPAPQSPTAQDGVVIAKRADEETSVWRYPSIDLLSSQKGGEADRGDVKENAHIIGTTLESFGIGASVIEVNGGPAITQYAIRIKEGTKLSKVKALQTDLALALAAPTGQIRIEAPIPGRNLVGIEIPNRSPAFVTLKEVLTHPDMKKEKSRLAIGLGLGVSGAPVIADIKKMPHVLVAGATGSGKSIAINNIICTLLFRNSPQELRFILVDPKRVELTGYNGIPHLLTPVITEANQVISALQWATKEMDKRYKMFAEVGARNIEDYNELSGFTAMEYIIIVIDELADIMLTAPSKVEDLIVRLAQMARATGIHLVIATQRPSVNVITGLIKANIPTRIAFNVASMIDSRVIIDSPGAEKLLGRGDMLFVPPDRPLPTRIQGTFVNNQEIRELINFLKAEVQAKPVEYQAEVTEQVVGDADMGDATGTHSDLFNDALRSVFAAGKASTSLLQRKLGIGYNKAAKIMDELEAAGAIAASDGTNKPRTVLINSPSDLMRGDPPDSNP